MEYEVETIYYLENPEKEIITFATGTQLKYEDTIKDVFGVACLKDLPMMIKYNKSFQDSIRSSHGISEKEITLEMVFRVASKTELLQLRQKLQAKATESDNGESSNEEEISAPFDSIIRLQEGIFKWDNQKCAYNLV